MKAVLVAVASGTVNQDDFTAELRKAIFPDKAAQAAAFLKSLGELKAFELIHKNEVDKLHSFQYRAVFGDTALKVIVALNDDNKIAGFVIMPE